LSDTVAMLPDWMSQEATKSEF